MIAHGKEIKVFCGNAYPEFAKGICDELGLNIGEVEVKAFADGEVSVSVYESVRGCDVFVVQPTCKPVNDNLMELLIMMDAFRRASAGRITAVIPYFGYARQDRKAKGRDPISAKLVANMMDNMLGNPVFVKYYMHKFDPAAYDHDDLVVVSPDVGSVARSRAFATKVHMGLAIVDKRRQKANFCEVMNVIGDVKDKICILYDDMIDTAGTLCNAAQALMDNGAREVYACASHGVLSGSAFDRIQASPLKEVMLLNTIPLPEKCRGSKIRQLDVSPLFAKAITRIYNETPISSLF